MYNKRLILVLLITSICFRASAKPAARAIFQKDSLIIVEKNPAKGFHHAYILFIPKGKYLDKKTWLLVEPNNTGQLSDDIDVHKKAAIHLASVSSVGNNVSTALKIPLLVPIFPRTASEPLVYTHALDRDIMVEQTVSLKRLDLQLLEMIADAQIILQALHIPVEPNILMNGFSASATFTNRFSFLHPGRIKALAIGGFNGSLMLPLNGIDNVRLNYPLGTNDFMELFHQEFDRKAYRSIPQYIYMGGLDDNDAVQFDDAYSAEERAIINTHIGAQVQERFQRSQEIYQANHIHPVFKTYDNIGHRTTAEMNLAVIKFFLMQMEEQ